MKEPFVLTFDGPFSLKTRALANAVGPPWLRLAKVFLSDSGESMHIMYQRLDQSIRERMVWTKVTCTTRERKKHVLANRVGRTPGLPLPRMGNFDVGFADNFLLPAPLEQIRTDRTAILDR